MADHMITWHYAIGAHHETLFLSLFIMHKYLSRKPVRNSEALLLVLTCLFMACKFEETIYYPSRLFVTNSKSDHVSTQKMLNLEKRILDALNYKMIFVNPLDILSRLALLTASSPDVSRLLSLSNTRNLGLFYFSNISRFSQLHAVCIILKGSGGIHICDENQRELFGA